MVSLASIISALTAAKDLILTAGPGTLRHAGDLFRKLADAGDGVADYIESLSRAPDAAMAIDHDREVHLAALQQLKAEVEAATVQDGGDQPKKKGAADPQAALGDRFGKILGPEARKLLLGVISKLIDQLMGKLGAGAPTTGT